MYQEAVVFREGFLEEVTLRFILEVLVGVCQITNVEMGIADRVGPEWWK